MSDGNFLNRPEFYNCCLLCCRLGHDAENCPNPFFCTRCGHSGLHPTQGCHLWVIAGDPLSDRGHGAGQVASHHSDHIDRASGLASDSNNDSYSPTGGPPISPTQTEQNQSHGQSGNQQAQGGLQDSDVIEESGLPDEAMFDDQYNAHFHYWRMGYAMNIIRIAYDLAMPESAQELYVAHLPEAMALINDLRVPTIAEVHNWWVSRMTEHTQEDLPENTNNSDELGQEDA